MIFSNSFPSGRLNSFVPSTFKDHTSFTSSNRYFSAVKEIISTTAIPFPPVIDPHGDLQALSGRDLVYAADNVVQYYKLSDNKFAIFMILLSFVDILLTID